MPEEKRLTDLHPGAGAPAVVNCIVETPKGRRNRYELDKATGLMKLDKHLFSASHYPGDYGFVPRTMDADGEPIDVLVMVNEPTFPGCLIEARVIGGLRLKATDRAVDSEGRPAFAGGDYKVLAVPHSDPLCAEFNGVDDVPKHFLREVEHFFVSYKQIEGVSVEVGAWDSREAAVEAVRQAMGRGPK